MSGWGETAFNGSRQFAMLAAAKAAGAGENDVIPRKPRHGKQLSLFPRKDVPRLQPHQASPAQFVRLPGIQWHGNYDESRVTKPDADLDLWGGGAYNSGGVHAGTKRAAKDALDWHGQFDLLASIRDNPLDDGSTLEDYGLSHEDAVDEQVRRGGGHGFLHPVLPDRESIVPGRRGDAGDDWGQSLGQVNGALRRELNRAEWEGNWEPAAPSEVAKGLRYENGSEHPGSISTLMPTSSPMQHSDYVENALRTAARGVHPLTHHLFNMGILDKVEAQRYLPPNAKPQSSAGTIAHSEKMRSARTTAAKARRDPRKLEGGVQMEMF